MDNLNFLGYNIRRLSAADAAAFRSLRLDSLRLSEFEFSTEYEEESNLDMNELMARLRTDVIFGAEEAGALIGIVGMQRNQGLKRAHTGVIWGTYVDKQHRRRGISRQLVGALESEVAETIALLELEVVCGNEPAINLYLQLGYEPYGIERRALRIDGKYFDRLLMSKELSRES